MAFLNEIGAGRYNRLIQKLFNMKGGPPARSIASDVTMIMPFFSGAEHRAIESWNRYAASSLTAAVAANTSAARIRNPTASNVIAVIEKLNMSSDAAGGAEFLVQMGGVTTADLASVFAVTNNRLDPRQPGVNPASVVSNQNSTPAVPGLTNNFSLARARQIQNQPFEVIGTDIQEITLAPGDAIQFFNNATVNTNLWWTVWWRERGLEDSEIK